MLSRSVSQFILFYFIQTEQAGEQAHADELLSGQDISSLELKFTGGLLEILYPSKL